MGKESTPRKICHVLGWAPDGTCRAGVLVWNPFEETGPVSGSMSIGGRVNRCDHFGGSPRPRVQKFHGPPRGFRGGGGGGEAKDYFLLSKMIACWHDCGEYFLSYQGKQKRHSHSDGNPTLVSQKGMTLKREKDDEWRHEGTSGYSFIHHPSSLFSSLLLFSTLCH